MRTPFGIQEINLTKDMVLDYFDLDLSTGDFFLRKDTNRWKSGWKVGHRDRNGHVQIMMNGRFYLAHRVVWLVVNGVWPQSNIDHIDGDKTNNSPRNLRLCNQSQNSANAKLNKKNTVGLKGVTRHGKRFKAQICVNRRKIHIGVYETPEQAHRAYMMKAVEFFGEFARAA